MSKITTKETYKNGDVIIKEGSFGDWTYVVLDGKVEISRTVNGEKFVVSVIEKGDLFGEMSYIDGQPRSAQAIAVGNVQVGILDKDFLDNELNKTSEDFRLIMKALTNRLRKTTTELVNIKTGQKQ